MKFKFSIMKKLVLGVTIVSIVTYGTSAFFIFFLMDYAKSYLSEGLFITLTLLLGIFWTGLLGMLAAKRLIHPIQHLMKTANEVAAGQINTQVHPSKSDDELRALGLSFEKMIGELNTIVSGIQDHHSLTDQHVDELRSAIGQATHHIEIITNRIEQISSGAENQTDSANVMLQSVQFVSKSALQVNEKSKSAQELTYNMNNTIEESEVVIQSLVDGMHKLAGLNRQSMEVVKRLNEHAGHIGEISNVVGDIADQTQLLALNASIEAAKAGEEGRGFAVVAEAVKKLAGQSAQAVNDIRELIHEIQTEISHVVSQISEQAEVAEKESALGEKATTALRNITSETDKVVQIVENVSDMIAEQTKQMNQTLDEAKSVVEIAARIQSDAQDVFASTEEQTALMEEISATSDQLKEHSINLRNKIDFFKY